MAYGMGDWLEAQCLKLFDGTVVLAAPGVATAAPTSLYVGLLTSLPLDNGSAGAPQNGVEVANANGYARVAIPTSGGWSAIGPAVTPPTAQQRVNASAVTLPATGTASGVWGTVVAWALFDSPTVGAGNMWCYGVLATPQAVNTGGTLTLQAGAIQIQFD